jgi:hypothetical protein
MVIGLIEFAVSNTKEKVDRKSDGRPNKYSINSEDRERENDNNIDGNTNEGY